MSTDRTLPDVLAGDSAIHGKTCPKAPHTGEGYLHGPEDDGIYDVDGVTYCGRCHTYLWTGWAVPR